MALVDDLKSEVGQIFRSMWDTQKVQLIPEPEALRLDNHSKEFDSATVLYADLDGSTSMVDSMSWSVAAEIYKAYLRCAAKIINAEGGTITAYDGDRIMAIFLGGKKNTSAVRAARKIHYAVTNIINPGYATVYTNTPYTVKHVIGIDNSELRAARIGVRGYNDLVWVGRAANHAAKLTSVPGFPVWITNEVYCSMADEVKFGGNPAVNRWTSRSWTAMNRTIYGTAATWSI